MQFTLKWYRKKDIHKYVYLCSVDREQESISPNDKANGAKCRPISHSEKRVYDCFLNYSCNFFFLTNQVLF